MCVSFFHADENLYCLFVCVQNVLYTFYILNIELMLLSMARLCARFSCFNNLCIGIGMTHSLNVQKFKNYIISHSYTHNVKLKYKQMEEKLIFFLFVCRKFRIIFPLAAEMIFLSVFFLVFFPQTQFSIS